MSAAPPPGSAEASSPPAADPPAKRREPFWDNARFACIVLVVVGHAILRMVYESDVAYALYLVVYSFHIPAFAIISGYFSKSSPPTATQMARLLTDLVVPYLVFETIWTIVNGIVSGSFTLNYASASWTLWFLLALAIFRLILPYLALLRWPLAWAVVISVATGYAHNIDTTFALSRTLGLLPFFVLGWWLRDRGVIERYDLLRPRTSVRIVAAAVLVAAAAAAFAFASAWRNVGLGHWFYYDGTYADSDVTEWWAGGIRLLLMVVAVVMSAAFFALLPHRERFWTHFGQYTLYVYLLHTFLLYPLRETDVIRELRPAELWLPVIVVGAVLLAMALATAPVRALTRPIVEPRPRWLFADPAVVAREGHRRDQTGARRTDGG